MYRGSIPALVTPFSDGKIDEQALEKLVLWHIEQGSHGLVVVGTTGESPTLSHEEHRSVIQKVVDVVGGRIPVIAGVGSNNTAESIGLVQFAGKAGADGVLAVAPYYNKPTQAGLVDYYSALNAVSSVPILIYNIPQRTAVDVSHDTMTILAKLDKIIGVKDATADLSRVPITRSTCGNEFIQLSGEDSTVVGFNAMGGGGCISVTANVAPALCSQLQEATLKNNYERAIEIQDRLTPLHQALFAEPGVCGAKFGLSILSMCSDDVRSPLLPVGCETQALIKKAMKSAGLI